jgi:hypothetical protein
MMGPMATDRNDFNLAGGLHLAVSMGVSFVIGGIVYICIFLSTHSGPDKKA